HHGRLYACLRAGLEFLRKHCSPPAKARGRESLLDSRPCISSARIDPRRTIEEGDDQSSKPIAPPMKYDIVCASLSRCQPPSLRMDNRALFSPSPLHARIPPAGLYRILAACTRHPSTCTIMRLQWGRNSNSTLRGSCVEPSAGVRSARSLNAVLSGSYVNLSARRRALPACTTTVPLSAVI